MQSVPGSKEDVFKSKALSLIDKRRLMRFLMFAAGEFEGKKELEGKEQSPFVQYLREVFSLDDKAVNAIAYALAFCTSREGAHCGSVDHSASFLTICRAYLPCSPEDTTVPPLYGPLWPVSLPRRTLWRLW